MTEVRIGWLGQTIVKATGNPAGESPSVQNSITTNLEAALGVFFYSLVLVTKYTLASISAFKTAVCLLDISYQIFFSEMMGSSEGFWNSFGTACCGSISHFDLSYFSVNQIKLLPFQSLFFPSFSNFAVLVIPRGVNRLLASHVVHSGGSLVCLSCLHQPPPFGGSAHSVHFFPSTTRYFVGLWISSDLRAITLGSITRLRSPEVTGGWCVFKVGTGVSVDVHVFVLWPVCSSCRCCCCCCTNYSNTAGAPPVEAGFD